MLLGTCLRMLATLPPYEARLLPRTKFWLVFAAILLFLKILFFHVNFRQACDGAGASCCWVRVCACSLRCHLTRRASSRAPSSGSSLPPFAFPLKNHFYFNYRLACDGAEASCCWVHVCACSPRCRPTRRASSRAPSSGSSLPLFCFSFKKKSFSCQF